MATREQTNLLLLSCWLFSRLVSTWPWKITASGDSRALASQWWTVTSLPLESPCLGFWSQTCTKCPALFSGTLCLAALEWWGSLSSVSPERWAALFPCRWRCWDLPLRKTCTFLTESHWVWRVRGRINGQVSYLLLTVNYHILRQIRTHLRRLTEESNDFWPENRPDQSLEYCQPSESNVPSSPLDGVRTIDQSAVHFHPSAGSFVLAFDRAKWPLTSDQALLSV